MKRLKHTMVGRVSFVLLLIFVLTSCDLFKLDINTDPSNPSTATPDLVLPNVMASASTTMGGLFNQRIHGFVGQMSVNDDFNMTTSTFSASWQNLYAGPLKDLDATIKYTKNVGTLPGYLGMAQVLKALYFSYMVDLWGNVPYFTAFNGDNAATPEVNPKYDSGRDIYVDLLALLDEAIVNLGATSSVNYGAGDPVYGGNRTSWVKAANSLKLKLLVQIRLVAASFPELGGDAGVKAKVAALIASPNTLISTNADDFDFRFNGAQTPDYRHPWFQGASTGGTNGFTYISHQLMFEMLENKDPRWPYYFKRQTTTALDLNDATQRATSPCSSIPGCQYGYVVVNNGGLAPLGRLKAAGIVPFDTYKEIKAGVADSSAWYQNTFLAGIFGRDRADNSGAANDAPLRTTIGCYPAGGYYDDNFPTNFTITATPQTPYVPRASATSKAPLIPTDPTGRKPITNGGNGGGTGNGIFPMLSAALIKFYTVEAMLTMGVPGVPADVFESAIKLHMDRVSALGAKVDTRAVAITAANRDAYAAKFKTQFQTASSDDIRLDLNWKQGWYAAWGNAIDSYNSFRRTGKPTSLQAPLNRIRQFALSVPLAIDELTLNKNAPQNAPQFDTPEAAIFWDQLKFHF